MSKKYMKKLSEGDILIGESQIGYYRRKTCLMIIEISKKRRTKVYILYEKILPDQKLYLGEPVPRSFVGHEIWFNLKTLTANFRRIDKIVAL